MSGTGTSSGTFTVKGEWVDAYGNPAPNPPNPAFFYITTGATWAANSTIDSHEADDGFKDPDTVGSNGLNGGSQSSHIISILDGSQTWTRTYTTQARVSWHNTGTNAASYSVNCSLSAQSVTKGAALTVPDPNVTPTNGNPANKYCFNTAQPGVLLNPAWQIDFYNVDAHNYQAATTFIPFDLGVSVRTSGPLVATNASITQQFTYTGLPASNSDLGNKMVTGKVAGDIGITDTARVQVFFDKDSTNHPLPDLPIAPFYAGATTATPNWYYYWSQTSANYAAPNHYYGGTHDTKTGVTYFDRTGQSGFNTPRNAWVSLIYHQAGFTTAAGTWNNAEGIDLFANICRHEEQHRLDMIHLWGENSDIRPSEDLDGDFLPDAAETYGDVYFPVTYNPMKKCTYIDSFHYGVNPLPDCEDLALRLEPEWVNGSANTMDWAFPGHQW